MRLDELRRARERFTAHWPLRTKAMLRDDLESIGTSPVAYSGQAALALDALIEIETLRLAIIEVKGLSELIYLDNGIAEVCTRALYEAGEEG